MKVTTYEGIVENGRVKLQEAVRLPERARVYVVVPAAVERIPIHVRSPHFAHPEDAADFTLEVTQEPQDAGL